MRSSLEGNEFCVRPEISASDIQWIQSHVTDDKVFCVYFAPSEQHLLDHARLAGMPADAVLAISREIEPPGFSRP